MTLQDGSLLCLATIPFAVVNSAYHELARRPHEQRARLHAVNAGTTVFFLVLAFAGAGQPWGAAPALRFARLWLPLVYYWWAYVWAGPTLHLFHDETFSFDRALIALEQRLFGNPALWLARDRSRWLNELMSAAYASYYLYVPVPGAALYLSGDHARFEAMAMAVSLGYAVCYSIYPWYPLWGPRWALVSEGLLEERRQVLHGYTISSFMNRLMWSESAHKGGAMPSAHSATCVIFMIWCARIWGAPGLVIGGTIGVMMFVSTVYGRYHYVIDVLVGSAIGLAAVWLADLLVAAA